MDTLKKQIMEINQLCNESDGLYHDIAQSYGLSDSIYWILYILYYNDCPVSQTELCSNWYYSKQTVNSSISAMTKKGMDYAGDCSENAESKKYCSYRSRPYFLR